jgi:hypothetical protein
MRKGSQIVTRQTNQRRRSGPTLAVVEHKGNGSRSRTGLGLLAMYVDTYRGCIEIVFESR